MVSSQLRCEGPGPAVASWRRPLLSVVAGNPAQSVFTVILKSPWLGYLLPPAVSLLPFTDLTVSSSFTHSENAFQVLSVSPT